MIRQWKQYLSLLVLLSPIGPVWGEEMIWSGRFNNSGGDSPWVSIHGELNCINISDWAHTQADTQAENIVLAYDNGGIQNLWDDRRPSIVRAYVSSDCRYAAKKAITSSSGSIVDLLTGKTIASSKDLFGTGELSFSTDNRYIFSAGQYFIDESEPEPGTPYATTIAGKRLPPNTVPTGIPVYGGRYYVRPSYITDGKGKKLWKLNPRDVEQLGPIPDKDFETPYLGHDASLRAQNFGIWIYALSSDGRYFIAEDGLDNQVYLGAWSDKGVVKKDSLPPVGLDPQVSGSDFYRDRLYAFSPDDSSIAIFHFLSSDTARLSLLAIDGRTLWEKNFKAVEEFKNCKASGINTYSIPTSVRFVGNRIVMSWVKSYYQSHLQCHVSKVLELGSGAIVYQRMDEDSMRDPVNDDWAEAQKRLYLVSDTEYVRYHPKFEGDKVIIEFYKGKLKGEDP